MALDLCVENMTNPRRSGGKRWHSYRTRINPCCTGHRNFALKGTCPHAHGHWMRAQIFASKGTSPHARFQSCERRHRHRAAQERQETCDSHQGRCVQGVCRPRCRCVELDLGRRRHGRDRHLQQPMLHGWLWHTTNNCSE